MRNHHVLGLQVAVHDTRLVYGSHGVEQLSHDALALLKAVLGGKPLLERLALDIFHHDAHPCTVHGFHAIAIHHTRVLNGHEGVELLDEQLLMRHVGGTVGFECLEHKPAPISLCLPQHGAAACGHKLPMRELRRHALERRRHSPRHRFVDMVAHRIIVHLCKITANREQNQIYLRFAEVQRNFATAGSNITAS